MTHQDPHSHSADAVEHHVPIEAQYVRQGRGGRRILILLAVSAGAAAALLLGLWAISNQGFQRAEEAGMTGEPTPVVEQAPAPTAGPETAPPPVT